MERFDYKDPDQWERAVGLADMLRDQKRDEAAEDYYASLENKEKGVDKSKECVIVKDGN